MQDGPRTLFIDIETAPILGHVWDLWNQNVGLNQIVKDWHLLSFAAKWLGEKKVIYEDQSHTKQIENDKPLVRSIWNLYNEADIVIGHNGKAFDVPKTKVRMLYHGLPPPSPFRQVDTKQEFQRQFGATSNKLEYLSDKFTDTPKDKHKEFPGHELWVECLRGNPRAWAEMRKYNIRDVVADEKLYLRILPWIEGHPNVGMYIDSDEPVCPNCGGRVHKVRICYTNAGAYQQYHCQKCGKYPRGRYQVKDVRHTIQFRKRQLVG